MRRVGWLFLSGAAGLPLALHGASEASAARPADAPSSERASARAEFSLALVATSGLDLDEFVDDLALRTQFERGIETEWNIDALEQVEGRVFVFAEAVPGPPAQVVLRIVTEQGRLYRRTIDARPGEIRVVASVAANVLLAVAQGQVEPEREGVALPEDQSAASVQAAVSSTDDAGPVDEPGLDEPDDEADDGRDDDPDDADDAAPTIEDWPRRISVALGGGPRLGLWPQYASALAGGGVALDVDYRGTRGLAIHGGLTGEGRRASGRPDATLGQPIEAERASVVLTRVRLHASAGYAPRWSVGGGSVWLPVRAGPVVEPTSLRRDGAPAELIEREGSPWLFGGLAAIDPTYDFGGAHKGVANGRLHLGLRLTMEVSYAVAANGRPVTINAGPAGLGDELVRFGGLELATRLAVVVGWGLRDEGRR